MNIAEMLTGGNPRTLGRTEEVVEYVLRPDRLDDLFAYVTGPDPIVRTRALDVFARFARADGALKSYFADQPRRHLHSRHKSVAKRAAKLLADPTIAP